MDENSSYILSICIPTYNRKERVLSCIQNILSYDKNDLEIVVCDNCSTDGTWEELTKIKDERLHCYRNEENYGASYNFPKVISFSTGKYGMLLNDRDNIDVIEIADLMDTLRYLNVDVFFSEKTDYQFDSIEKRAALLCRLKHTGKVIYSHDLLKKVFDNMRDDERYISWGKCIFTECCISEKWYNWGREPVVKRPIGNEYATLKKTREENDIEPFWTIRNRKKMIFRYIDYIQEIQDDKEACIRGIYEVGIEFALNVYFANCKSKEICQRYNYCPPRFHCWLYETLKLRHDVISYLEAKGNSTDLLKRFINKCTIKKYLHFIKYRIVRLKKYCENLIIKREG